MSVKEDDPRAWVPIADWEEQHRLKRIYQKCLVDVAKRLNLMADEIDSEKPNSWAEATAPAPFTDSPKST